VLSEKAEELLQFMEKNIVLSPRRRISGRFKIDSTDPVTLESESDFQVREISISGMMIEAEVALKPDTALQLEMRLGRMKFVTPARIIYLAEIDLQEEALRYRMGVEFIGTAPDQQAKLEKFIRRELKEARVSAADAADDEPGDV
jgi:c-di-GMP-binding flagellar brake protein YcgR